MFIRSYERFDFDPKYSPNLSEVIFLFPNFPTLFLSGVSFYEVPWLILARFGSRLNFGYLSGSILASGTRICKKDLLTTADTPVERTLPC